MHQQSCIDACVRCAQECEQCAAACLGESDVNEMTECIRLDLDCAAICRMAAGFMSRDSRFAEAICDVCADICETCGTECEKHDVDHCQRCAEACHQCAEECRSMAGAAV
jgi:hypothetical protein